MSNLYCSLRLLFQDNLICGSYKIWLIFIMSYNHQRVPITRALYRNVIFSYFAFQLTIDLLGIFFYLNPAKGPFIIFNLFSNFVFFSLQIDLPHPPTPNLDGKKLISPDRNLNTLPIYLYIYYQLGHIHVKH